MRVLKTTRLVKFQALTVIHVLQGGSLVDATPLSEYSVFRPAVWAGLVRSHAGKCHDLGREPQLMAGIRICLSCMKESFRISGKERLQGVCEAYSAQASEEEEKRPAGRSLQRCYEHGRARANPQFIIMT